MSYKIISKFIKDISFEIPSAETFVMIEKEISKYILNFDIKSIPFKNNIIEVNTVLKISPTPDVKNKMLDNDLIDFSPQSPMMILHCNGDDNVPYENAIMAYDSFIELGSEDVFLLDGGNFNHSECALFSIISAKMWFDLKIPKIAQNS